MSFDFPFGKLFGNLLLPLFGSKFEFFFLQKYGAAAKCQTSRFHYGSKVPAVTITVFITILEQNR
jgi:hypothetical protein